MYPLGFDPQSNRLCVLKLGKKCASGKKEEAMWELEGYHRRLQIPTSLSVSIIVLASEVGCVARLGWDNVPFRIAGSSS